MNKISPFKGANLEAISKILADTHTGLTGSEIGNTLRKCRIKDVDPKNTKWKRLYHALVEEQNQKQYGNHVIAFIHKAMNPVTYTDSKEHYEAKRDELNKVLSFSGLKLREDGRIKRVKKARTISDAQKRANRLESKLRDRGVHKDVLKFCDAELLQENYFHAVLEACKSVANKIRALSGLKSDGAKLAQQALSLGKSDEPIVAINDLNNETDKSEQTGFLNLVMGLFGMFRNTTAHAEKIYWPINEQDALDIMSLVSLVHRKLDTAQD
ncbi:TIGR02391 family protein [Fodinibius sp. SL11]|uniref:TIGR02391 family protein n=1 Tax=Fodinibius sp. SL11 TaxID=3425690 RepID=UPI003F88586D